MIIYDIKWNFGGLLQVTDVDVALIRVVGHGVV